MGNVSSVKPAEEPAIIFIRPIRIGIGHLQLGAAPAALFQRDIDLPSFITVFRRIVHQNIAQFRQHLLLRLHQYTILDLHIQLFPILLDDRTERFCRLFKHF